MMDGLVVLYSSFVVLGYSPNMIYKGSLLGGLRGRPTTGRGKKWGSLYRRHSVWQTVHAVNL